MVVSSEVGESKNERATMSTPRNQRSGHVGIKDRQDFPVDARMDFVSTSPSERDAGWVAGVDGHRDGWVVVLFAPDSASVRHRTMGSVDALQGLPEAPEVIGIDMVIGLPEHAEPGGRRCDRLARKLLGHPRGSSVFSPPARSVLGAETYEDAQRLNRASGPEAPGLSRQSYHLLPKMKALAEVMTPERQDRIWEVHPELSFCAMNDGEPLAAGKQSQVGQDTRAQLLQACGMPGVADALVERVGGPVGADDLLDAYAACWTAARIQDGTAERCPPRDEPAPRNNRGLRMEIWR